MQNNFFEYMRQELNLPETVQADLFLANVLFEYELSMAPAYERVQWRDLEWSGQQNDALLVDMFYCDEQMPMDPEELELRCDEDINDIVIPATDASEIGDDVMTVDSFEEGTIQSNFTFA